MTAVKNATVGLGKSEYKNTVKAARDAAALASAQEEVKNYEEQRASGVALRRELRELHAKHLDALGAGNVESAISELDYSIATTDRYLASAKARVEKLTGAAPADDNDE